MKKEVDTLDATPSKRLYTSIIADYDLNKAICELVDNAIDIWTKNDKKRSLVIEILPNIDQQIIIVRDNAGGLEKPELKNIIAPGHTSNKPEEIIIGIFGVGSKRAVVALAQDVQITTRYNNNKTYMIEINDDWLKEDNEWDLPVYEVNNILPNTTNIELKKLRFVLKEEDINNLKDHLGATYAKFIEKEVTIKLFNKNVIPKLFENWSFPPTHLPVNYTSYITTTDNKKVKINIIAGLTNESSPAAGEYGVYFYCNDRLIARKLKTYELGFTKGKAGLPHPSLSLARIIVSLDGEASLMPWNSSKSDIYPKHQIFVVIQDKLIEIVKYFTSLSRRWEGSWSENVFAHQKGSIENIELGEFPKVKLNLPPLPQSKPRYADKVSQKNKSIVRNKPWSKGLYECIIAVDLIQKQKLEQKNRICLILLDSTLEIAFKEYLVNETEGKYSDKQLLDLFKIRENVQNELKRYVEIKKGLWDKIDFYYHQRCKLIHEKASVSISDDEIEDYRDVVQKVLNKLYNLKFN